MEVILGNKKRNDNCRSFSHISTTTINCSELSHFSYRMDWYFEGFFYNHYFQIYY